MMDKGTATDINPVVATADGSDFKLDPHLLRLMWDEPFFSHVLRTVTKIRTEMIPTAGVLAKDGDIKMWWNPDFLASLTPDEVKGLLKHECYHLVFHHTTTRRLDPHIIWNYATDLAINSLIPENELPKGGLIPGKAFDPLTEEQLASMTPDQINRFNTVSEKIESFPTKEASEWYFARLMEDEEVKDAITDRGEGEDGAGSGLPGNMDDHDGWGEMSDEEAEIAKNKVKKAVESAAKECDKKGQWGTIGAEVRDQIRATYKTEIPWQSVLKQFVGYSRRANRSSNIKRMNRKYPGVHPGAQRDYTASIAVYVDQSGSVSNEELELLFGELAGLARHTEFVCYHFDTEVDEDSEATWKRGNTPLASRTRCGGTNFKAPSSHANKNRHRFDGYLILTDGYASNPGPSKLRRGWVITTNGEAQDFMGRETTIKMKKEAKS
jgi:predicted metal-dependent peptidase